MRTALLIIFLIFVLFAANAQENEEKEFRTLFDNVEIKKIRGFGGPMMSFTTIDGQFAHMMGGGGGVILNDKFFFGGSGMGLTTRVNAKPDIASSDGTNTNIYKDMEVDYGFGGFWLGYIIKGSFPIHPIIHTQIGWGDINIMKGNRLQFQDNFFVLHPALEMDLNITQFLRIGLGASYNLTFGVSSTKLKGYSDHDFSGLGGFLSFKFGWF